MINLHYEIRICQKTYNRVTMTIYVKCVVRFNVHKTLHVHGQWKSKNSCSWAGMSYSAVAPRRHGGGLSYANVCTRGWPQRWCFSPVCVEVEQMLWLKHSKAWWLVWPQFLSLKELSWYSQVFASIFFFMDRIPFLKNLVSNKVGNSKTKPNNCYISW